jgi:hypothetical protein
MRIRATAIVHTVFKKNDNNSNTTNHRINVNMLKGEL